MHTRKEETEEGVSPVVGVMLMLVVTIIIAAVVSGFAGGLMGGSNKGSPSIGMDIQIKNTGTWMGSGFSATVTSVSEPIPTDKLKIVTSWQTRDRDTKSTVVTGGNSSMGQITNTSYYGVVSWQNPPFGFGPGVSGVKSLKSPYEDGQTFGNYTLMQGTGLSAYPAGVDTSNADAIDGVSGEEGSSGYGISENYKYTALMADPTTLVLGKYWENLTPGDSVKVDVVYLPTGKVILSKTVPVSGGE